MTVRVCAIWRVYARARAQKVVGANHPDAHLFRGERDRKLAAHGRACVCCPACVGDARGDTLSPCCDGSSLGRFRAARGTSSVSAPPCFRTSPSNSDMPAFQVAQCSVNSESVHTWVSSCRHTHLNTGDASESPYTPLTITTCRSQKPPLICSALTSHCEHCLQQCHQALVAVAEGRNANNVQGSAAIPLGTDGPRNDG